MLTIKKKQLDEIINHAFREYPLEACGIAAGKEGQVKMIYPLTNQDRSTVTYFASPEEQLKAFKDMRKRGLELLAIYHSHPASDALPSAADIERAFYPEAAYVIVSLKNPDQPDIRAFRIVDGKVNEIPLKVMGEHHACEGIR